MTTKKQEIIEVNAITLTENEVEVITNAQRDMQTNYSTAVLVNQVAKSIGLPNDGKVQVELADVLTVIKRAQAMHLDPLLGAIYAFKNKDGKLTCGVSKQGWQMALHSQPDFVGLHFENIGELVKAKVPTRNGVVDMTYYIAVKCVIEKRLKDGTIGKFEGIAYHDEECDLTKSTWVQRPKRMLESRALTICASNAYGWGAYDEEEVRDIEVKNLVTQSVPFGNERANILVNKISKDNLIQQMSSAINRQQLVEVFKSAPKELKEDVEIIELGKELNSKFENEEL